jgi:hypothetical protein
MGVMRKFSSLPHSLTRPAPPPIPAPAPRRRKRMNLVAVALFTIALIVLIGAWLIYRDTSAAAAHADAVETLLSQMQLEQQDSMPQDSWQGGISIDGTNYMLMSFRADNRYVKEFLQTLATPTDVLVMFIDNRQSSEKHIVDFAGAKLFLANKVTRKVPEQSAIVSSAGSNRAAAIDAFPAMIQVPPEKILWGRLLFIGPDVNLHELSAVAVQIDGKEAILEGGFFTAAQKRGERGER